ncbi:MAG: cell division protein FtsA [candidate division NC10 bacterium]|nr:cell division protein FtsA [candidate division NC10 bacterium]
MTQGGEIVTGLDIGTTKICVIIAELTEGGIEIIGCGTSPSRGLKKGVVVNIDVTVESIKKAVEAAEAMAGISLNSAFVVIAGSHIKGINSRGVIAVSGKNQEVIQADVDRVIEAAKAITLPADRRVIHVIPQEFIIDGQGGVKEPLGMSGHRLEAEIHIVTGAVASAENIIKCATRAGLEVQDIVLQPLASSEATLTADEKELGVVLVDIGGGTSDIAVFVDGSIRHTAVLALGGDHLTHDIAIGLRTPPQSAEAIKCQYGCALTSLVGSEEVVEVPSVGGRKPRLLSRHMLCEIMQPRMEEIFSHVALEVRRAGFMHQVAAGIVVTGGSSVMEGVPELAEQLFDLPVRLGVPTGIGGLKEVVSSPMYATGVGLVQYGAAHRDQPRFGRLSDQTLVDKLIKRMMQWFSDFL